jgi:capsular exopolysaccharide synthesis family protein
MIDNEGDRNIFAAYDSESPIATSFRRIFNNLRGRVSEPKKSFLITSASRGEGKSTIASHLALTAAQFTRKKVLVIDADIRRPRMHKIFNLPNTVGLYECLNDFEDPLSVVKETEQNNLHVITAGMRAESPSKLFESEAISNLFQKVLFYYDYLIVDSAPVLAVSDTLFLCAEMTKVVFVVLAGSTPREVVVRAKDLLHESNAEILGVVLNNAMETLPYYYSYKYYEEAYSD